VKYKHTPLAGDDGKSQTPNLNLDEKNSNTPLFNFTNIYLKFQKFHECWILPKSLEHEN